MTDMLSVPAFQFRDPVPFRIPPEGDDTPLNFSAHELARLAV